MKPVLSKNRKCRKISKIVRLVLTLLFLCSMIFMTGCSRTSPKHLTDTDTAMGTVIIQQIYMETAPRGFAASAPKEEEDITEEVLALIRKLETETLSKRVKESEISSINEEAGKGCAVPLSPGMEAILSQCLEISRASGGAFDITIGEVAGLWDIDTWAAMDGCSAMDGDTILNSGAAADALNNHPTQYELPDKDELSKALTFTGYEKLTLENQSIRMPEGMSLDLGAVGKGIALDEILTLLQEREVSGAVISVGGSILTYGEKPDKSPWRVAIADPDDRTGSIGVLTLTGQWCISTSGDYERYVEVDGIRYHHLIDPATGYPARSGLSSVTILTKSGFLSDALSTACFVLGEEKGMELAKQYAVEAIFVREDGSISMTEGMQAYFHLSKSAE